MLERRTFLHSLAAPALSQRRSLASRPNVVILMSDDQGYGDFSCHGNPVLKTPAIDRLHGESIRLTDFHVAPMCTPTRSQLMSGQDALRNGATSVTAGRALLRRGIPTMADVFAASGYRTGIFGKWHLGDMYPYRPHDRGFHEARYHRGFGMHSAVEFTNDYFDGTYQHNGVAKRFTGYCTDFWFSSAIEWMRERRAAGEPFFCYLPTNTPHGPAWVDPRYAAPYRRDGLPANFFGMIANLDENVARLEAFLREAGLRDNTIFIFMTDNGATAGFSVHNAGMRGRKTQIYEGGHRVPCFIRWPGGKLRAPGDVDAPAQNIDLLPTLIDLCGLTRPADARFDGTSLAGLLRGSAARLPDRMLVVQYGQIPEKFDACTIWGKWRLIRDNELYNLDADPGQKNNVAAAHPEVLARMKAHYEEWWAGVAPRLRDFAPISIGAPEQNPVQLVCCDWQDVYADNPTHVGTAAGGPRGGPWTVWVERDGDYEFELSRWPLEMNLPLDAPCPEQKKRVATVPAGKAIPVAGAKIEIDGQTAESRATPGAASITFRVALRGGRKTTLHAWFTDAESRDLAGAFFARVYRRG